MGEGSARLKPDTVRRGLADLVHDVLDRVSEVQEEEAQDLRDNWDAVLSSERDEHALCQTLAALGEDPYDPEDIDENVLALIESQVNRLEPGCARTS